VNVVGHDNELVQQVRCPAVVIKRVDHKPRPRLS